MDEKEILGMALGLTVTPREVCADMSPTYAKGIREQFPDARLVFDFFHVVQLLTIAVEIPEVIKVAKSIKEHWNGIVSCLETCLINVGVEAMNSIIQTAKRKARGFRSFPYFQTIICLVGSKLTFALPIPIPTHPPQTT